MMSESKVLLAVDDEPTVLELIEQVGVSLGYLVETASYSGAFMTAYVRTRPDVIALDISMPEIDGLALLNWLAGVGSTTPIIIIFGADELFSYLAIKLGKLRGLSGVLKLRKPFRISDLRNALLAYASLSRELSAGMLP